MSLPGEIIIFLVFVFVSLPLKYQNNNWKKKEKKKTIPFLLILLYANNVMEAYIARYIITDKYLYTFINRIFT